MTNNIGNTQMQIDKLIEQRFNDIARASDIIKKAIRHRGPFSHNIISMTLQDIAKKYGNEKANMLVREYALEELFGIEEV